MAQALYGAEGFFVSGAGPAAHFRTSVHASPVFADALLRLIHHLDGVLDFPDHFDVVDVGAGRGELLHALSARVEVEVSTAGAAPVPLAERVRFTAVELAPRPAGPPERISWTSEIPAGITGLLLATEWLDNVPLDLAAHTGTGWHYLLVDPSTGAETTGAPVSRADAEWLSTWWPTPIPTDGPTNPPGGDRTEAAPDTQTPTGSGFRAARPAQGSSLTARSRSGCPETPTDPTDPTDRTPTGQFPLARAEIGRTRDEAWAEAVGHVDRGLALAVDYGHLRADRPVDGTLTGYRGGRQVPPVPDGSCDVTAHVAMDSVASAGERVARCAYLLGSQRAGLRALGAEGGRPPLSRAASDPAGYLRALAAASASAELTDPAGLGGHWWLWQPVGVALDRLPPGGS
ncbi:hypothetical protein D2L64_25395 [Micromonospora radicis]|uniref:SAM-dependent methyltransferase n=2 Tax=Micromonospora radicis TaxID=1894971 RepID=A0A418MNB4_9ACTN|nr:hypothetical protein D2L64_25395 [Micromonospora radicis]